MVSLAPCPGRTIAAHKAMPAGERRDDRSQ